MNTSKAHIHSVDNVLANYESIDLKGLDQVTLLNRLDSKYVFHISQLASILEEVKHDYLALEIDELRKFAYESLYFDTPDYLLYKFHHNGKLNRLKVRYRRYKDSGLTFFEVKYKVKGDRTDKKRIKQDTINETLSDSEYSIISHPLLNNQLLEKKMWIYFHRITLANKNMRERLTIDIALSFDNMKERIEFPEIVVAEVKQDKSMPNSSVIKALKSRHFEEVGFSKYSSAVAWMEPVKNNLFKPNFIKVKKIIAHG